MCGKCQINEVAPINPREYEPLTKEAISNGMQALNQLVVDGHNRFKKGGSRESTGRRNQGA